MKKIGIITVWGVPNYGTFFQAYALRNVVRQLWHDSQVEVVPYLADSHYKTYYGIRGADCRYKYLRPKFYLSLLRGLVNLPANKKKENEFLKYYETLSFSKRINADELKKRNYDTVILGSDIVWDFSIPFFGNDRFLFGLALNATKKVAYAASFGTVRYGSTIPEYVKKGLNELDAISVRETNSQAIVKSITNTEQLVVSDPTFIYDFENDKNIPPENKYGDYIVVYGSTMGDELIKGCVEYAKKHNLKIICLDSLDDKFDWCDINIKQKDLTPFEWLAMFKHAKIIFTCTFHGLMFGLIFKKPIVFNPLKFILDKAESFIDYLGLRQPLIEAKTFEEKVSWDWDYKRLEKNIEHLKNVSVDFLKENV